MRCRYSINGAPTDLLIAIETSVGNDSATKIIKSPPLFYPNQDIPSPMAESHDRPKRSISPTKNVPPRKIIGTRSRISKAVPKATKTLTLTEILPKPIQTEEAIGLSTETSRKISAGTISPIKLNDSGLDSLESTIEDITHDTKEESSESSPEIDLPEIMVKEDDVVPKIEDQEGVMNTQESENQINFSPPSIPSLINDGEKLIAQAKEMVQDAKKNESTETSSRNLKRKAQDREENFEDCHERPIDENVAKKQRTESRELRKEKTKNRALLGITMTLAIG